MMRNMGFSGAGAVTGVGLLTFATFALTLTWATSAEAVPKTRGKKEARASSATSEPAPVARAATPQPNEDLAAFLEAPARQALEKRNYKLAVSLYRGIVAIRGEADPAMIKLAEAWTLGGQFDAAADEWERYRDAVADPNEKLRATQQIQTLRERTEGFSGDVFEPQPAIKEATLAFKKGRQYFGKKKYVEAILLFKAGYAMAPDMPGPLRELGESYDQLGRTAEATEFFIRYLQVRPFGKNADRVRERLVKSGHVGKLSVESSFPCEIVMMNRQLVPGKLPIRDLVVAPGTYKLLCYSERYHTAQYVRATVEKNRAAKAIFQWAILENKLDPWGRIVLENPDNPGEMRDVGLFEEIGIPVPSDRRALKMIIKSGDGKKSDTRFVKLEPGKRIPIQW